MARVLVADDEEGLLRVVERMLTQAGHNVATASDGRAAIAQLDRNGFDVIVSDIQMPGMDGIGLLRQVRERDMDLPVIFVTGNPDVRSASAAVKYGAFSYLHKPVPSEVLTQEVTRAARLHSLARAKRQALQHLNPDGGLAGDLAGLEAAFARAIQNLTIVYQPIVDWKDRTVFGFEALARVNDKTIPHIGALFDVAERLFQVQKLGRVLRGITARIQTLPGSGNLFVNIHPHDLQDEDLFAPDSPLVAMAKHVVIEITERAALDHVEDVRSRIARLRALGFRIAVDDLGAGYAGLSSFANLEPDIVKLDMALVRGIDREPIKQKIVGALISVCAELGIMVIAEGIETVPERETVVSLGCRFLQGFLFARPTAPFPAVVWGN